jgi:hypothetical protein
MSRDPRLTFYSEHIVSGTLDLPGVANSLTRPMINTMPGYCTFIVTGYWFPVRKFPEEVFATEHTVPVQCQ